MKEYTHYLLTKFNIVASWYKDCAEQKGGRHTSQIFHTQEWLNERIRLFETYCLPSVANQSAEFVWLVEFNSKSDKKLLDRIDEWKSTYPFFIPLFVEPYADDALVVREYISKHANSKFIISTNLDSDDMLHKDFLSKIQSSFDYQDGKIIHYSSGLQYIEQQKLLYSWQNAGNHFYSFIEKTSTNPQSCVDIQHGMFSEYIEIGDHVEPGWIEIVHNYNVYNHTFYAKPVLLNTQKTFNVKLNLSLRYFMKEYIKLNIRRIKKVFKCHK